MGPLLVGAALKGIESQLTTIIGPAAAAGDLMFRADIGLPDCAVTRKAEQYQQQVSATNRDAINYCNPVLDVHALIETIHKQVPDEGDQNLWGLPPSAWLWLRNRMQLHGVDMALPGEQGAPAMASDWLQISRLAAEAAPLDAVLRGYWRTRGMDAAIADHWDDELKFALRRRGFSRQEDRTTLKRGFAHWSTLDAERLAWLGQVDEVTRLALYNAAGAVREEDTIYAQWLNARIPDTASLIEMARRLTWDDDLAERYGLDVRFNNSPLAVFFARAQGEGRMPGELPGQPQGSTDWLKLAMRTQSPIVGFGVAREMQHRLRPAVAGQPQSVVPGVAAWTKENTLDMLAMEGYSAPLAQRMAALVPEPINIRIVNHILTETLKHPQLAAQAQALMGAGVDWVKNAFLDHGFADGIAQVTADAIRQAADDAANAERLELEKKLREESRAVVLRQYELGMLVTPVAVESLKGRFVTEEMAIEMLSHIDNKLDADFIQGATAEIKTAFLEGKLTPEQVGGQFNILGINPARQARYMQEWIWARNDRARMLATGEIFAALKHGLMTPQVALVRLINLGWTQADAMVELAAVQQDIDRAAAATASAEAAKVISAQEKAKREAEAKAKAEAAAKAKADAAAERTAKLKAQAPLAQELAGTKYTALALMDLDAYNAAKKKGNKEKMQAEVNKAAYAYADLLLTQLKLVQAEPETADAIQPINPIEVPPPDESAGAGKSTAGAPSPPSGPATSGGGTSPPAAP
jgi:hypothetical protein